MDKVRKKNIKRIIALCCAVAVIVFLAMMPLIVKSDLEQDGPKASILSDQVTTGNINIEVIGGGTLSDEESQSISVPNSVQLVRLLVSNGDTVTAGTPIASVDRVTVMVAISQVQETLEYLSEQIEKNSEFVGEEAVTALAGGIVKILYAEEDSSVQSTMLEHGALAVLSLDGLMAVDLETDSTLSVGSPVSVTLSDGTSTTGKVTKNLENKLTVTIEDNNYLVADTVQITTEDGTSIGSGQLYIYSPWNATAYTGMVDSIQVNVGDTLHAGDTLMVLSDVGYTATYQQLIVQRQEYEQLMKRLFEMYQTETITAPCDGIVSGIDQNSMQLLQNSGSSHSEDQEKDENGATSTAGSYGDVNTQTGIRYPSGSESFGSIGITTEQKYELYDLSMTQIATVTPQTNAILQISVDELDINNLQVGMAAQVKINALGGEKHDAVITQISNIGENNGGNSKYIVELTMERTENMLSGMNATAVIVLSTVSDVLTVPADALVEDGNHTYIYTGYDEETETLLDPVSVTVGCSDGEMVEILDGLVKDQNYFYAYYDTLEISFTPDFGDVGFMFS